MKPATLMIIGGILILFFSGFMIGRASVGRGEPAVSNMRKFVNDLPAAPIVVPGIYEFTIPRSVTGTNDYRVRVETTVK